MSSELQKIPRFQDRVTGIDYDKGWFCTECHWAITTNRYNFGKDRCPMCGGKTKEVRTDYPRIILDDNLAD